MAQFYWDLLECDLVLVLLLLVSSLGHLHSLHLELDSHLHMLDSHILELDQLLRLETLEDLHLHLKALEYMLLKL